MNLLASFLLLLTSIFLSCEAKEIPYDAFEKVKENKELGLETYEYIEDSVLIVSSDSSVKKTLNDWQKYQLYTFNNITLRHQNILALKKRKISKKNQANFNKQIEKLEKDNLQLKAQIIQYHKEREASWQKFKLDIEHQSDVINTEIKFLKSSKGEEENYLKKIFK